MSSHFNLSQTEHRNLLKTYLEKRDADSQEAYTRSLERQLKEKGFLPRKNQPTEE